MNITKQQSDKIDRQLNRALQSAKEEDPLRAIIIVASHQAGIKIIKHTKEIGPEQFASYPDYRLALLKRREAQVAQEIKDAVEKLQQFHLSMHIGSLSRNIIVEGAAREILRMLDLPEVQHASLDQPVILMRPRLATNTSDDEKPDLVSRDNATRP